VSFYRLIKPDWSKPLLDNGQSNPRFVKEIKDHKNTHEGCNFSDEFIKQKNEEGYNIYFFPNHPSKNVYDEGVVALSGKHIDVFNYLFVDMDLKDKVYASKEEFLTKLNQFPLKPSMVVNSGNGIHAYWAVSDLTRDLYVFSQLCLIRYFNTDESVYTVLQLMRLPGYNNTKKHDNPIAAEILSDYSSGSSYSINDFPQEVLTLTDDDKIRGQKHLDRLDGKLTIHAPEFVNIDEIPEKFFDFINDTKNKMAFDLWMTPKETYGDRSGADMKLANLLFKSGFNKKEALSVISNTQKALSHGNRKHYAETTIDKVYTEKLNSKFMTVGQLNRTADADKNLGDLVKTSWWLDTGVLGNPMRKRELTGIIAGPGVGKTSTTLKLIKDAIKNNPENDDIYAFFTLEMAVGEIQNKWNALCKDEPTLADRLYVIGNENEKFEPRNIGMQEILEDCLELKKLTGKNLGMIAIDHIGLISKHIDIRKKYTFGIDSEQNAGYGNIRTLGLNTIARQMKPLCKQLDTHIILLTQTTKEKGVGDLPIGKDGAYGISDYENIMDRIFTVWQPLKLVQGMTATRLMAWQYVKIRNQSVNDKIQIDHPKLMSFDLATGNIEPCTQAQYEEFSMLYPKTVEMRKAMVKKEGGVGYSIHISQDVLNKTKNLLGIPSGDKNDLGKVQSNQHS
jgi:hypothetical protein